MSRDRSRRRQDSRPERDASTAPFRRLRNPWKPLDILSPDEMERLHEASMRILENIGIEFLDPEALDLWERAGARVAREADNRKGRVWIDRGLLLETLALAPREFTLHARRPECDVVIGGNHIVLATASGPAYTLDLERGRRPGTLAACEELTRLSHVFNVLHCLPYCQVEPTDLPVPTRHLDFTRMLLKTTDRALMGPPRGRVVAQDVIDMVAVLFGGHEIIEARPAILTVINVNSPLRYDEAMLGGMITYARAGQPVVVTPFILAGAMGPITIVGSAAQQNAEALAGLALIQLARPGAPAVYGGFTTDTHMRSGNPSFGTPEGAWATLVGAQLARRYNLPYRASGGLNSSPIADAQAAYESMNSLWPAMLAHSNFVLHAAGWVEGGLTASYEKLIIDVEMLAMFEALLGGFEVSDATLALDSIEQVGPGGHHFDTALTMERYSTAFYNPLVSIRQGYESWSEGGGEDATQRACRKWKQVLAAYEMPPMEPAVVEALDDFVARRKGELAGARP
jgi:trimethylamine--corrinoid protein Co-methyltransferase